jgi:hypothetical protein
MAIPGLRDRSLLNVLANDTTRREWASWGSDAGVELPPGPNVWDTVSSTAGTIARGGAQLISKVAERLTSAEPTVSPPVVTSAGPLTGSMKPDGENDDLKEVRGMMCLGLSYSCPWCLVKDRREGVFVWKWWVSVVVVFLGPFPRFLYIRYLYRYMYINFFAGVGSHFLQ